MLSFMSIAELCLAAYLLVLSIRGKSKLFKSPYVTEGKEAQYRKTSRAGFITVAALLVLLALMEPLADVLPESIYSWLLPALSAAVLLSPMVLYIFLVRLTDKFKRSKPARPVAPRSAFFFDEDKK